MSHIVIVGGGQAAGAAAETAREQDSDAEITVVAREPHGLYQRPPLSKGYLAGSDGPGAVRLHDADWYADQGIAVRTGLAATEVDAGARRVGLADGTAITYTQLLLATGATARALPVPGADLEGVHTLRTIDDADALGQTLRAGGKRVVVIGSGWIGMEAAATARQLGNDVTVLGRAAQPLEAALGARMGQVFARLHADHGVTVRGGVAVERVEGSSSVTGVVAGGERVDADVVIAGVGAELDLGLARTAGARIGDGVLVDAAMRTSVPDVWAAGDIAAAYHPMLQRHLRSEHWATALAGGGVAGAGMAGAPGRLAEIPFFFSDQFDLGMELSGFAPLMDGARLVVRGDEHAREFIAFWVDGDRVVGGMNINVWDVQDDIQSLIRSGVRVDVAALADPDVALSDLTQG